MKQMRLFITFFIVFVLIFFITVFFLTSNTEPNKQVIQPASPSLDSYAFPSVAPALPAEFIFSKTFEQTSQPQFHEVFYSDTEQSQTSRAITLAGKLGFTNQPNTRITSIGTQLFWQNNDSSLLVSFFPLIFYFSNNHTPSFEKTRVDTNKILQDAGGWLSRFAPLTDGFSFSSPKMSFFVADGPNMVPGSVNNAQRVDIEYRLIFEGLPLFVGRPYSYTHSFRFTPEGDLISFTFLDTSSFSKKANSTTFTLVSPKTVVTRVLAGNASVVWAYSEKNYTSMTPERLIPKSVVLDELYPIYFFNPSSKEVVPVYHLIGSASDGVSGKTFSVHYYAPAL